MSPITSLGVRAPYNFTITNSPLTANGLITLAFNPGAPLIPLNGGTGLAAVGTNGQFLTSNGTAMVWTSAPPTGVSSVLGSSPVLVSNAAARNISLSSTGSGIVVLGTSPTFAAPTVTGGITFSGPFNGTTGANTGPGIYPGLDGGGNGAIEMVAPDLKFIDFTRVGVDYDGRILFSSVQGRLSFLIGASTPLTINTSTADITSPAINLVGPTNIQGTTLSQIVTTNGSNKISSVSLPLSIANGGTGLSTIGTNGQYLTSNGTIAVWATYTPSGTLGNTTINGFLTLTGPLNATIPGAAATPGIYMGFDAGGDARIQLNSPTRYSFIDFGRPSVGVDWRIIHDDVTDTLQFQSSTKTVLNLNNTTCTLNSTNIALTGSTLIQGTTLSQVVTTDSSNKISSIALATGSGAIVRDNGSTLFNNVFSGNTQFSTNYAWYTGASSVKSLSFDSYKPPILYDFQGTLLAYDNGVFTNNTGANIFVTVTYSLQILSSDLLPAISSFRVLLNGVNELARSQVTANDFTTGTANFKLGINSTFQVQGESGDVPSVYGNASNLQYSFRYYV